MQGLLESPCLPVPAHRIEKGCLSEAREWVLVEGQADAARDRNLEERNCRGIEPVVL